MGVIVGEVVGEVGMGGVSESDILIGVDEDIRGKYLEGRGKDISSYCS